MKKVLSLMLCLVLLIPCFAFADNDYSYIEQMSKYISLDVLKSGNADISTKLGIEDLKFSHPYFLEDHPSYLYSDVLLLDYNGDAKPVWRIWVEYSARNPLGINSVSISLPTLDDDYHIISNSYTKYTFLNVGGEDRITADSDFTTESICIALGQNNYEFCIHLGSLLESFGDYDAMIGCVLPATLHGAQEDVDFNITGGINADLWLISKAAYSLNPENPYALFEIAGTEMTATETVIQ